MKKKHALELVREAKKMGKVEFCKWIGIHHDTYNNLVAGKIDNVVYADPIIKINEKTGLDLCELLPDSKLCKMINK